jgi:hypothetical protein
MIELYMLTNDGKWTRNNGLDERQYYYAEHHLFDDSYSDKLFTKWKLVSDENELVLNPGENIHVVNQKVNSFALNEIRKMKLERI